MPCTYEQLGALSEHTLVTLPWEDGDCVYITLNKLEFHCKGSSLKGSITCDDDATLLWPYGQWKLMNEHGEGLYGQGRIISHNQRVRLV